MADPTRIVVPFERVRPSGVHRNTPVAALNGTLSWQTDEHTAFDRDLDTAHLRRAYSTGVEALDGITHGVLQGNVLVVAGRTGGGKSSFAMTTAMQIGVVAGALPVLYASLEMTAREMAIRSLAWLTGISQTRLILANIGKLRLEDHERELIATRGPAIGERVRMMAGAFTLAQVRAEAQRMQDAVGLSLVILDHVGIVTPEGDARGDNREREVAAASRAFKEMAMSLNVGGMLLAQMNRESAKEKEPELHHLRASSQLEQDASNVVFIWPTRNDAPDRRRLFVKKNRFGLTAELEVPWEGAFGRIGECVEALR